MKAFVTGGGGFLGLALVKILREGGHDVVSLQRGYYPELEKTGTRCFRGDIGDLEGVKEAAAGCDTVFHVAAKAGVWGKYDDYYRANVLGTRNIIDACRDLKIPRLIFTSSPSAIFSGRDENGIDESAPYPRKHLATYPRTKAIAEGLVLSANGGGLATVALRPHLIWGPGDPHLVPRVIERAIAGRPTSTTPPGPTSSPPKDSTPTPPAPERLTSSATASRSRCGNSSTGSSPPADCRR